MILIGQYDSPFVRRAAITMNHHNVVFERKVLSVFKDFDALLKESPLGKVPALILDNGEHIFDSRMIIDYVEHLSTPETRLLSVNPDIRWQILRIEAIALGLAEKSYERGVELGRRRADKIDTEWTERLKRQIVSALNWLDSFDPDPWLFGDQMTLADITCSVAFTFLRQKQQISLADGDYPSLEKHCDYCESLPAWQAAAYSADEAARSGWKPHRE